MKFIIFSFLADNGHFQKGRVILQKYALRSMVVTYRGITLILVEAGRITVNLMAELKNIDPGVLVVHSKEDLDKTVDAYKQE